MARHPKMKFSLPPIFIFSQFFTISLILFSQFSPLRGLRKRYFKTNFTIGSHTAVAFQKYAIYLYGTLASRIKSGKSCENRTNVLRFLGLSDQKSSKTRGCVRTINFLDKSNIVEDVITDKNEFSCV